MSVWDEAERRWVPAVKSSGVFTNELFDEMLRRGRALERVAEAAKRHWGEEHELDDALTTLDKEPK